MSDLISYIKIFGHQINRPKNNLYYIKSQKSVDVFTFAVIQFHTWQLTDDSLQMTVDR